MNDDLTRFKKYCKARAGGCVEWTGPTTRGGYARFVINKKHRRAARWIFERIHGKIPADLHHVCGNRSCVRPAHCRPLPHADHMKLHAQRGAWNGSRNSQAVRTEADVLAIRFLAEYFPFLPVALVAKCTNTPLRSVYWILNGGGWNHIQLPSHSELEAEFAEAMREAA